MLDFESHHDQQVKKLYICLEKILIKLASHKGHKWDKIIQARETDLYSGTNNDIKKQLGRKDLQDNYWADMQEVSCI